MSLTERRKQFLKKLIELFKKTNLPVHYQAIANALGVSKWTAYDILKELEKLGYVSQDYIINPNEIGRSHIVFIPTSKAINLFEEKKIEETINIEWEKTTKKILELLTNSNNNINVVIQKILEEIMRCGTKLTCGAYIIGLFLIFLKKLGGKTEILIKNLIKNTPNNESRILLFIGTTAGSIIQNFNNDIGIKITEILERYLNLFAELADNERKMLADFFNDALITLNLKAN